MHEHVVKVFDGHKEYQFACLQDANEKFLGILKRKLVSFLDTDLDIDYFDVGAWMFYDNHYVIPSNLMKYVKQYRLDIFEHITKDNLQELIMGLRIEAKAYKDISLRMHSKNDSRAHTKDAK